MKNWFKKMDQIDKISSIANGRIVSILLLSESEHQFLYPELLTYPGYNEKLSESFMEGTFNLLSTSYMDCRMFID